MGVPRCNARVLHDCDLVFNPGSWHKLCSLFGLGKSTKSSIALGDAKGLGKRWREPTFRIYSTSVSQFRFYLDEGLESRLRHHIRLVGTKQNGKGYKTRYRNTLEVAGVANSDASSAGKISVYSSQILSPRDRGELSFRKEIT